jgi:hypothetical protein
VFLAIFYLDLRVITSIILGMQQKVNTRIYVAVVIF